LLVFKVWLDVDELDDLAKLEEYVRGSVLVLAFISKGYFLSANCQRELKAAIDAITLTPTGTLALAQHLGLTLI
jgi:hypothetical protein